MHPISASRGEPSHEVCVFLAVTWGVSRRGARLSGRGPPVLLGRSLQGLLPSSLLVPGSRYCPSLSYTKGVAHFTFLGNLQVTEPEVLSQRGLNWGVAAQDSGVKEATEVEWFFLHRRCSLSTCCKMGMCWALEAWR